MEGRCTEVGTGDPGDLQSNPGKIQGRYGRTHVRPKEFRRRYRKIRERHEWGTGNPRELQRNHEMEKDPRVRNSRR
jgi:hypothetical protein